MDQQESIMWDWMNDQINMIYNFMTQENILTWFFCFPVKPFLLWYALQVDKACLCKQRWNVSLFLSTWSCQIWLLQLALSPLGLLVYCNWITTSYTNNLFFVSKLFMLLSLCYIRTLLMLLATLLISYLLNKIIASYNV